jgi:hypothetical protein
MISDEGKSARKIPILLLHGDSKPAYFVFNPNEWPGASKPIILSCAAQYGLLNYGTSQVPLVLKNCEKLCRARFSELQQHWAKAPWNVDGCCYFVEIPEFHLYAQMFLSTIKTFLDLLVQLVTTEGIVNKKVHGFHKKGSQIGGELLHCLDTKAYPEKRSTASQLKQLIEEQKGIWIDQSIELRDNLVHPEKGLPQVMFTLEIKQINGRLGLVRIVPPTVNGRGFSEYAQETMQHVHGFSELFLKILKAG